MQNRVRAERDQGGEARFQGRAAAVDALDLELTVITGSGPIVELEPAEAEPVSDVPQAQGQPGPSGSPGATIPPVHGTPRLNLTYEGAVYYATALSDDEPADLNENDLELVGATTESNLLLPAGSDIRRFIVLNIYKLKDGEEGYVYTFTPGQSMVNPEDGQIFEFPAVWMRWAAADSNGS